MVRHTIIVHDRHAISTLRLQAARAGRQGLQVMTFEQVAARLAGGFLQVIDDERLRDAVQAVLPDTMLDELDGIRLLPGMVGAVTDTLHKAWRAGIDIQARAGEHPRLESLAKLELAVLEHVPASALRPCDIVQAALERLDHAPAVLGAVQVMSMTELWPCWRPLLHALAEHVPVEWCAGPRPTPEWLEGSAIRVSRFESQQPRQIAVSAATAYHEAVEAMRWVRELLVSGTPSTEVAIAAVAPADYDSHFLTLRADANLDLHFVHGVSVLSTHEGQATAALADLLLRGLSQARVRRLSALMHSVGGPFETLPSGWTKALPADAPLTSLKAWVRFLNRVSASDWPDGNDHCEKVRNIVTLLAKGSEAAEEIGETILVGRPLRIWRKALAAGPANSLDLTLGELKIDDGLDGGNSVCWMPASALAASPRKFVRLLGLNSSRWPRGISEDRLLSDHIVPTTELDPLPAGAADRRDFATIVATTEQQVVLSHARRDSDGRLLGKSMLITDYEETYLRRNDVPSHAFSETDRLTARIDDFRALAQAASAHACWHDWHKPELTAHDGLVRPDHPVVLSILGRTQSASSLRQLLRNPMGFVWRYGLRWREPDTGVEPLVLDALAMGDLIHQLLDKALQLLELSGGWASAGRDQIAAAVEKAVVEISSDWENERPVPPAVIWRHTLDEVRQLSTIALGFGGKRQPGLRCFGEVPFGGSEPKSNTPLPWDSGKAVEITGTGMRIAGYIDRLDIAENGQQAFVGDYKTGQAPKKEFCLKGGSELQRCLYAFAVSAMLGSNVEITSSLIYPRTGDVFPLPEAEKTLDQLRIYLNAAKESLRAGRGVLGIDGGGDYDDRAFALPANSGAVYRVRKEMAILELLGSATDVWEAV